MTPPIPAWQDGTLTPTDKLEVHRRGLRHKAVSVFVMRGDETLLQRRALSKYHTPGLWANACCTHPLWDEPAELCARRRLREELGLTGLSPVPHGRVEYRAPVGDGLIEHEVVDLFVAEAGPATTPIPNPDEVAETRWMTLDSLGEEIAATPEKFTPWLRIYLREHAFQLFPTLTRA
ncbi:isopentenyl-diphosphate delta-isomerase [Tranquillimonas rosea]|uniref:Isopentenyl-diphosphate Delta-isomerase n=1 Tax=Tranquillimonas rosea TaxID=641238 RepID=A0A1H9SIS8_9RHOB|nr:isopentenyl-diphosphate Delta-isomerase [Tranquillimonas rosea]SER84864.1 isopentenyl-diphosphate delta-isomerase [Tranquillimonas rosea]